ncbi:MAG TPA: hypothetical protein VHU82_04215 [Vicinamibacterales bacterium]|jgi:hypothetical protein|nr:hypothetical protein [Vicinamibacterales bacterium]
MPIDHNFIDGCRVPSVAGQMFEDRNPWTPATSSVGVIVSEKRRHRVGDTVPLFKNAHLEIGRVSW